MKQAGPSLAWVRPNERPENTGRPPSLDLTPVDLADALEAVAAILRDHDRLARDNRDQEQVIDVLKGALAAQGLEVMPGCPDLLMALPKQARALVGALYGRYPNALSADALLECLPSYDRVEERTTSSVRVAVHAVRQAFGCAAIISGRNQGYRLSAAFHRQIKTQPTGEDHGRSGK